MKKVMIKSRNLTKIIKLESRAHNKKKNRSRIKKNKCIQLISHNL